MFNIKTSLIFKLHANPLDVQLIEQERTAAAHYSFVHTAYVSFLRQKSKLMWLKDGDLNTKFFHNSIRMKQSKNKVHSITNMEGNTVSGPDLVADAFVKYYQHILGTSVARKSVNSRILALGPLVANDIHPVLIAPLSSDDVYKSMRSIAGIKAPGPDGFGSQFDKDAWPIVGESVVAAVQQFFENGKLLTEVNSTSISLIPKVAQPTHLSDFRPISSCSVIYKCITKILCARMKLVLPDIFSQNQSGFVESRNIVHNIMVIQDLLKHYGRKNAPEAVLVKMDLRKAYDMVEWSFLEVM